MAQFIRIGQRIINLDLLVYVEFIPPIKAESINDPCFVVLIFSGSNEKIVLEGLEAECFWNCHKKSALSISPSKTYETEANAETNTQIQNSL